VGAFPNLCTPYLFDVFFDNFHRLYGITGFSLRVQLRLLVVWSAITQQHLSLKHKFLTQSQKCVKRLLASSHLSVCLSVLNNTAPNTRISMILDTRFIYLVNSSSVQQTKITGTLHEDLRTFMILSG